VGAGAVTAGRLGGSAIAALACLAFAAGAAGAAERAKLPKRAVESGYVAATGDTIAVHGGGDLQAALDAAGPGDEIVLDAGATFTGNFTLPATAAGDPIVVRSSDLADLPPEGQRVSPADAADMPRIESPDNLGAVTTEAGASEWRFVGIEFGVAPAVPLNTGIVRLGDGSETRKEDLPSDIVVDRCWLHGNPTADARRGVALNGRREAVVDSYLSDFHEVGGDAQAIAGWAGPGPFKVVGNHLEGAAENVMFGGADPRIDGIVPSDIEFRRNHLVKPLSWRVGDPSYAGVHWTVKNLFELKNARRVLVEGNLLENVWGDAQAGFAFNLKSANQDGTAPWSGTQDVTVVNNVVRHAAGAVGVVGRDPGTQRLTRRVTVSNNLFEDIDGDDWDGAGIFLQVVSSPPPGDRTPKGPEDLIVEHNTALNDGSTLIADGFPAEDFVFTANIAGHGPYGVKGSGESAGEPTLKAYFPGYRFRFNALVGGQASLYPPRNFFPATWDDVGFEDLEGGDYRLAPSSPLAGQANDGSDPGADIDAIEAATG